MHIYLFIYLVALPHKCTTPALRPLRHPHRHQPPPRPPRPAAGRPRDPPGPLGADAPTAAGRSAGRLAGAWGL